MSNLYKRGNVWWGRVQVRGRELRRSLRTGNRAEAKARRDAWLKEASHFRYHGEPRLSWKAAVLRYTEEILPGLVKPSTATRYLCSLRQVDHLLRDLYIDEITTKTIARIITDGQKRGATNATKRRDLTAVSSVLGACVAWGFRDDNPARAFDRSVVKERREPIRPPSDEDVATVIRAAPKTMGQIVACLERTGMREEEAVGLERPQVNMKTGEIVLYRTKTSRPRVIKMDTPGGDVTGTLAGTVPSMFSAWVFWHGQNGDRYHSFAPNFAKLVRRLHDKKLISRRFRAHDLRHLFAIRWLQNGGDIYALSRHLGHSSVKTTEIYLAYVNRTSAQEQAQEPRFGTAPKAAKVLSGNDISPIAPVAQLAEQRFCKPAATLPGASGNKPKPQEIRRSRNLAKRAEGVNITGLTPHKGRHSRRTTR